MAHIGALAPLAFELAAKKTTSGASGGIFLLLILALLVFMIFRSQRGRARQQQNTRSRLHPGVEVQTTAGLLAKVTAVDGDIVTLEVAPGVHSRYAASAVVRVLTPTDPDDSTPEAAETEAEAETTEPTTDAAGADEERVPSPDRLGS